MSFPSILKCEAEVAGNETSFFTNEQELAEMRTGLESHVLTNHIRDSGLQTTAISVNEYSLPLKVCRLLISSWKLPDQSSGFGGWKEGQAGCDDLIHSCVYCFLSHSY